MAHPDYERHETVFENAEAEAEYEFYANASMAEVFEAEPEALEAYEDFLTHLDAVEDNPPEPEPVPMLNGVFEETGRRPYMLESIEKETAEYHFRYEENADYDYLRESGLIETYSDHHLMVNNGI